MAMEISGDSVMVNKGTDVLTDVLTNVLSGDRHVCPADRSDAIDPMNGNADRIQLSITPSEHSLDCGENKDSKESSVCAQLDSEDTREDTRLATRETSRELTPEDPREDTRESIHEELNDEARETKVDGIESMGDLQSKMSSLRVTEKWGQSVGVLDANGSPKRLLDISEVTNYLQLNLQAVESELSVYFALISPRYPRFLRSTPHYNQRWRMRYNIFVGNVLDDKPESVVHMGEIHLYFDIVSKFSHPFYVNSSMYRNQDAITDGPNNETVTKLIGKIERTLNEIRFSKDLHQLKFPLDKQLFNNCDAIFDKFMERQTEFDEEAQNIHQKHLEKMKRFGPNMRRGRRGYRRHSTSNQRSRGPQTEADNDNDVTFEDTNERHSRDNTSRSQVQRNENRNRRYSYGKRFDENRRYFNNNRVDRQPRNGSKGPAFRDSAFKPYGEMSDEPNYRVSSHVRNYQQNRARKDSTTRGTDFDWQSSKAGGEQNGQQRNERYHSAQRFNRNDRFDKQDEYLDGERGGMRYQTNNRNPNYTRGTYFRRNSFVKD